MSPQKIHRQVICALPLLVLVLSVAALSHDARAESINRGSLTHDALAASEPKALPPFVHAERGADLADSEHPVAVAALRFFKDDPAAAALDLGSVFAHAIYSMIPGEVVVDVIARHPRFQDAYPAARDTYTGKGSRPRHHGLGGLGMSRVALAIDSSRPELVVTRAQVVERRSVLEMDLHIRASIGDTVAMLEDRKSGMRRLYPLGVRTLDFIRSPDAISSLTPTTELGRLDKRGFWEIMRFPRVFRDQPYLPLHIPRLRKGPEGEPTLIWRATWIAFHIWQPPRFARGFLSHGCVRMRGGDLLELAAFVFGVEDYIPVVIRAEPQQDFSHPHWKLDDRYFRLRNIGTEKTPKYWIVNGVWVTEYAPRVEVPAPDQIVGITIDPANVTELYHPGDPPVLKEPWLPKEVE